MAVFSFNLKPRDVAKITTKIGHKTKIPPPKSLKIIRKIKGLDVF